MSAVNPDYFMALRYTEYAYREGVGLLVSVAKNPPRTEAEVHGMLGRRHPHLTSRFGDAYESVPVPADQDQPGVLFMVLSAFAATRIWMTRTAAASGSAPDTGNTESEKARSSRTTTSELGVFSPCQ